jgi:hypothetical protein
VISFVQVVDGGFEGEEVSSAVHTARCLSLSPISAGGGGRIFASAVSRPPHVGVIATAFGTELLYIK